MPKTCYFGLKSSRRICKHALITHLLAYIFVKRKVRKKGRDRCTFSSAITIITEVQINLSTRLQYQTTNICSQTQQIIKPHKCHTPPELLSLQIALYFTQTSKPFFALLLQLAILLYERSTFEQKLKVASYIDFQLSSRGFKYIIQWSRNRDQGASSPPMFTEGSLLPANSRRL